MTLIDILILLVIAAGIILGGRKGLISQIVAIAAIVIAVVIARNPSEWLTSVVAQSVPGVDVNDSWASQMIVRIVVFLFVYLVVRIAGSFVRKIVHGLSLGIFDRIAGAIIGVAKYLFGVSLLLNFILLFSPDNSVIRSSRIADGKLCDAVVAFAPKLLNAAAAPVLNHNADKSEEAQP